VGIVEKGTESRTGRRHKLCTGAGSRNLKHVAEKLSLFFPLGRLSEHKTLAFLRRNPREDRFSLPT
jgi:hypothetical protein